MTSWRARIVLSVTVVSSLFAYSQPREPEFNEVYRGEAGTVFSSKPNVFLVRSLQHRKPRRALDAGMGQGRNSIFLAQHGWDVTGFDISDEGVRQARLQATRRGLKLNAVVSSFEQFDLGEDRWDLIVLTYVSPDRNYALKLVHSLRPGGAIVMEDRHVDSRRVWPEGTYRDNELLSFFPGLRVTHYEDVWDRPDWQAKHLHERILRIMAEKPAAPQSGCSWEGDCCLKAAPPAGITFAYFDAHRTAGSSPARNAGADPRSHEGS